MLESKLLKLRSGLSKFNSVVVKTSVLHCLSGFYTLKFQLPDHLVNDIEGFKSEPFMDARPFGHVGEFTKKSNRATSGRLPIVMYEIVNNMTSALGTGHGP